MRIAVQGHNYHALLDLIRKLQFGYRSEAATRAIFAHRSASLKIRSPCIPTLLIKTALCFSIYLTYHSMRTRRKLLVISDWLAYQLFNFYSIKHPPFLQKGAIIEKIQCFGAENELCECIGKWNTLKSPRNLCKRASSGDSVHPERHTKAVFGRFWSVVLRECLTTSSVQVASQIRFCTLFFV